MEGRREGGKGMVRHKQFSDLEEADGFGWMKGGVAEILWVFENLLKSVRGGREL